MGGYASARKRKKTWAMKVPILSQETCGVPLAMVSGIRGIAKFDGDC